MKEYCFAVEYLIITNGDLESFYIQDKDTKNMSQTHPSFSKRGLYAGVLLIYEYLL